MKRILIADDQATARELLKTVLSGAGYQVFEAIDGNDAVARAAELRPDLILLDIHMPGKTGFEVCDFVRNHSDLSTTPIIAITAGLMSGERERALSAGFTEFVSKPVSISALRLTVARLLAG
ncbi:MAG: response regulator [Acidobacteriota bacterium]|nr:response regulator [Acidobacteriota bacterium]